MSTIATDSELGGINEPMRDLIMRRLRKPMQKFGVMIAYQNMTFDRAIGYSFFTDTPIGPCVIHATAARFDQPLRHRGEQYNDGDVHQFVYREFLRLLKSAGAKPFYTMETMVDCGEIGSFESIANGDFQRVSSPDDPIWRSLWGRVIEADQRVGLTFPPNAAEVLRARIRGIATAALQTVV